MRQDGKERDSRSARFSRVLRLMGSEALEKLREARVVVAGMGAVGSFAVEGLARSGIGHLTLVDFDVVQLSNVNRQLYALNSTIGKPKVEVARARVLDINPECDVHIERVFIDDKVAPILLSGGFDVLIDAIDSVNPKVSLIQAGVQAGIPVISSMGAATRTDPLSVRVADISDTERCPLARFIRKKLKKKGIESGVRCVFSIEHAEKPKPNLDLDHLEGEQTLVRGRMRAPLGSLCPLPGIFGLTAAREAMRLLDIHLLASQ